MPDIVQVFKLVTTADLSGLQDVSGGFDRLEGRAQKTGGILGTVGKGLAILGGVGAAGVVAGLGASVKSAADFEGALNAVSAASGATGNDLELLRAKALQVGKDTSFSASEAIEGFGELAKAGFSAQEIVNGVGESTVKLAESQGASIADMATLMVGAQRTWNMGADQAASTANKLAAVANASAIDIGDLTNAIQNGGPIAQSVGLSFDDFTTAIGIMGNHAVNGAEAGTELKSMLVGLEGNTPKTKAALEELGVSMFDANGKTRNFRDVLADLQKGFSKLNDEQRAQIGHDLFGTYGINAANILLLQEGTDGWDKFQQQVAKAPTVAEQSATRLKGLNGQIEVLRGTIETLAISVGTKFLPIVTKGIEGINAVLSPLIDGDWKGALGVIADGLGNLAGAVGGFLASRDWSATGRAIGGALLAGLQAVGGLAGDLAVWIGEQLAGIDWGKVWGGIQDLGGLIWRGLVAGTGAAVAGGGELAGWIGAQLGGIDWSAVWGGIQDLGGLIWHGLVIATGAVVAGGDALGAWLGQQLGAVDWGKAWGRVQNLGDLIWGGLVAAGQATATGAGKLQDWIGGQVKAVDWKAVFSSGGSLASGLGAAISDGLSGVQGALSGLSSAGPKGGIAGFLKNDLIGTFSDLLDKLKPSQAAIDSLKAALAGLQEPVSKLLAGLQPLIGDAIDLGRAVLDAVTQLKPVVVLLAGIAAAALDLGLHLAKDLLPSVNDVITIFTDVIKIVGDVLGTLGDMMKFIDDLIHGRWSKAWDDAKNIVMDAIHTVGDILGGVFDLVRIPFEHILTFLKDIWSTALDLITKPASAALDALGDAGKGILGGIWSAVTGTFHDIWQWLTDRWSDATNVITAPVKATIDLFGGQDHGILGDIFGTVTTVFHALWKWFNDAWSDISRVVMAPFRWIADNAGGILSPIAGILFAPFKAFYGAIDTFIRGVAAAVNWILDKLQLSKWDVNFSLPELPGLARGTDNWRGGLAMVGEEGPEIVYLPQGAAVLPNPQTRAVLAGTEIIDPSGQRRTAVGQPKAGIDIPGFVLGLDPDKVLGALKGAWDTVSGFVDEWVAKGAGALLDTALSTVGASFDTAGPLGDMAGGVVKLVKNSVTDSVKELLGIADKARPVVIAVGGGPAAGDIVSWANSHAKALGMDPKELATALLAVSQYENGMQTGGDRTTGAGPFQLTGITYDNAVAHGYNPASASGSLDFFVFSGDMAAGLAAYRGAGGGSAGAHAMELAMERPLASADAERYARGDWDRAWATAQAVAAGGNAAFNPVGAAGGWVYPLAVRVPITQGFGPADPSVAGWEPGGFHEGIDLGASSGSLALAAHAGVIKGAGWGAFSPGTGIAAIIDSGQGLNIIYGHLQDVIASVGQVVNAGDPLAHTDNTGTATTAPHLHFQTNQNGVPVDPRNFVALAGGGLVTKPTIALLGEAGPEAVIPGEQVNKLWDALAQLLKSFGSPLIGTPGLQALAGGVAAWLNTFTPSLNPEDQRRIGDALSNIVGDMMTDTVPQIAKALHADLGRLVSPDTLLSLIHGLQTPFTPPGQGQGATTGGSYPGTISGKGLPAGAAGTAPVSDDKVLKAVEPLGGKLDTLNTTQKTATAPVEAHTATIAKQTGITADASVKWLAGIWDAVTKILIDVDAGIGPALGKANEWLSALWGNATQLVMGLSGIADEQRGFDDWIGTAQYQVLTDGRDALLNIEGSLGALSGVPHLATGGIAVRPTLAVIGDAGPEAVLPLRGRQAAGGDTYVFNEGAFQIEARSLADIQTMAEFMQRVRQTARAKAGRR